MAIKISTGLRDHILVTGSAKAGIDGGVIRIYNGTPPATADDALSGNTLLDTISLNDTGAGISMDSVPAAGVLSKDPGEVWSGTIVAAGTATFYRFSPISDTGTLSTTIKRIQGTVAVVGGDLNFSSVAFVSGLKNIDTYDIAMPTP